MKAIYLDSFRHYRLNKTDDGIQIIEYSHPDDPYACFKLDDEKHLPEFVPLVLATLKEGEEAEFILGRFKAKVNSNQCGEELICGDDFIQELRGDWKKP